MSSKWELNVEVLKDFLDVFNDHDLDRIMDFFHEDCILEMPKGPDPWGERYVGKEETKLGLASRFKQFPDVHFGNDRHWVVDNFGVSEWTLTGTLESGERVEINGTDHLEFKSDKIYRKN